MRKIENLLFPFSSTLDCYHGRWVRNVFDNVRIVKCKERGNQEGGKAYLRSSAGAGLPSLQVLAGLNTKENCSIFVSVAKNRAKQWCRSSFDQSELESHGLGTLLRENSCCQAASCVFIREAIADYNVEDGTTLHLIYTWKPFLRHTSIKLSLAPLLLIASQREGNVKDDL